MALLVKKSQLPNAGKGLFTTKAIKAGTKIIEYRGEIINWKQYMERVKRNEDGYLFFVNKNYCIDAFPTPQYKARYANDAEGLVKVKGLTNNSVYEVFGNKCFIVAERDIKAGEEIFVDYTQEYWDCIRYNIKHGHYKKKSDKSIAA
jgi:SET domain-containing protein